VPLVLIFCESGESQGIVIAPSNKSVEAYVTTRRYERLIIDYQRVDTKLSLFSNAMGLLEILARILIG
jgi:hypothetical protein